MTQKTLLPFLLSVLFLSCFGQTEIILSNQNGFEIAYKAQKLNEGNKDKWLITVTAINKTADPLCYTLPTYRMSDGSYVPDPLVNQFSSKVTVRNATGFLASDGVKIKGEPTNIYTENRTNLLVQYDPGRIYNYENTINVKHGDTPIVTITHAAMLKGMNDFNIETSATLVDGDYKTSCGANSFSISLKRESAKTLLIQSVNGKQVRWIQTSATMFVKENDTNSTLSYNKAKKTFAYSSSDGINCEWTKL